jgi:hypothetical protein
VDRENVKLNDVGSNAAAWLAGTQKISNARARAAKV